MKNMTLVAGTMLAMTASSALAGGEGWIDDYEAAKAQAAKEKKDILVDFTGSDWCHWCVKLKKEVFDHDPFKKGVADKFVLLELDFPNDKSKMDAETIKQNDELKNKFKIRGFPTILLLDAKGRPFAQTGYQKGGPEQYVKHLDELRGKRVSRDEAMAAAEKQSGVEKAKALVKALSVLSEDHLAHYKGVVDEIAKLDPEDESGFVKAQKKKELISGFQEELMKDLQTGKTDELPAKIDKFIADNKIKGELAQELIGMKVNVGLSKKDFDLADKALDEIIALDPKSTWGKRAAGFKPQLANMKKQAGGGKPEPKEEEKEEEEDDK